SFPKKANASENRPLKTASTPPPENRPLSKLPQLPATFYYLAFTHEIDYIKSLVEQRLFKLRSYLGTIGMDYVALLLNRKNAYFQRRYDKLLLARLFWRYTWYGETILIGATSVLAHQGADCSFRV
ncbi:hypothetical protein Tco_1436577, partial [Tanacetum coccineum]